MQCPACRTDLPPTATFCSACGTRMEGQPRFQPPQPPAAGPDLVFSGLVVIATLIGIWTMKWYMWPVYLAGAAASLWYGLRSGAAALQRSTLFLAAGAAGQLACTLGGNADLPEFLMFGLIARGVWGVLTEGRTGRPGFRLTGRRFQVTGAGFAAMLVSLFFTWRPATSATWVSWATPGTFGNPNGPFSIPTAHTIGSGSSSGIALSLCLLPTALLLYCFRSQDWPRWLVAVLTICYVLLISAGISALGTHVGIGIILYTIGFVVAGWGLLAAD